MFYSQSTKEVFRELGSGMKGLTLKEAESRLRKYGPNELEKKKEISKLKLFLSQFNSFLVYILIAATLISALIGEITDSIVILVILIANAILGFLQEYKAEKSIEALRKLSSLKTRVIRDGKTIEIDSKNVVPGDILVIDEGMKVPADARIIESFNIECDESSLTGESVPVSKNTSIINKDASLGDRKNMLFSGTVITKGRGKAIVVATGMKTEIGKIADLIENAVKEETPLQKKLGVLGKWLGIATVIISAIVFVSGILRGGQVMEMFMAAIALAVAAVPEGLPAVVTISLALGVKRMVSRNALIRKLPSVETLGCANVICTDKTGTLTKNEMTVKKLFTDNKLIEVTNSGYDTHGQFFHGKNEVHAHEIELLLRIGALNNNSELIHEKGSIKVIGDPTEAALIVSAEKAGFKHSVLKKKFPLITEIPFDSSRKRMTTIHKVGSKNTTAYVKGAPDVIIDLCTKIYENNKIRKITKKDKEKIMQINKEFASEALRVLAFAFKDLPKTSSSAKNIEKDLVFVGLQGMIDPPRKEVKGAIARCNEAGIKVIMITGDFEITAKAIGKELGIEGKTLNGKDIDKADLKKAVNEVSIYARVNPEHKMKIIDALQKNGYIVAMTGDGVNDAPALKESNLGIAMGIKGTDVAKESSDMILLDDNFASIVNAVEEGRAIEDNIKKFVNYMLSSNFGEVLILFVAMIIGFRDPVTGAIVVPLVAVQLLWLNLVTDGFPALALGIDGASSDIMKRKPRTSNYNIISKNMSLNIVFIGIIMAVASLLMFKSGLSVSIEKARTMAFTTIVTLELVRVQMIRSQYKVKMFSNKWLWIALSFSMFLQLLAVYTPLGRKIFETVPLGLAEWIEIVIIAGIMLGVGSLGAAIIKRITKEQD